MDERDDRCLKAFALSVLPGVGIYVAVVVRVESLRHFDHSVPYPQGFLIFLMVLALAAGLIAFGVLRQEPPPRWGVTTLVAVAWCVTLMMAIPLIE